MSITDIQEAILDLPETEYTALRKLREALEARPTV